MVKKRRQSPRRKSQGNVGSAIGSAVGKGVAKGCIRGCSRGFSRALPIVLISIIYLSRSITLWVTSLNDFFIGLIQEYQISMSPQMHIDCFFEPSCSNYAIVAINKYGLLKGLLKAMVRVIKCNPFMANQRAEKITDLP